MKIIAILIVMFLSSAAIATPKPADTVDFENVDVPFLEQLIKVKIDSIRKEMGLVSLAPDDKLYQAAKDHAIFLWNRKQIGHYQPSTFKRTAYKRAEYYGAENLKVVGENVIYKFPERKTNFDPYTLSVTYEYSYTYEELADDMVRGWVESEPHYENVRSSHYRYTAVAINFDDAQKEFMCVQVFADYFP